jgi:hypothetical protein
LAFIQDGVREDESYLSGVGLADEASGIGGGVTVLGETEAFYVRVDGYPRGPCDGCGGRRGEGVVGDGGCLLLHGRASVRTETRVPATTTFGADELGWTRWGFSLCWAPPMLSVRIVDGIDDSCSAG